MQMIENEIVTLLDLEQLDTNLFRGASRDIGTKQVFGGQVLGQALSAAQQTVEDRNTHSAHAYFLRKGDFNAPIIYQVERTRDGRSFSARRVTAIQHGRPIFVLATSFQIDEDGLDYDTKIELPSLEDGFEVPPPATDKPNRFQVGKYIEARIVDPTNASGNNSQQVWARMRQRLPDDPKIHRNLLAYMSDFGLLTSTLVPHGITPATGHKLQNFVLASIDHAIWFHRPFRVDEWLYYQCTPISTSSSRGLARGSVYTQDGRLVATTMQEGLIRKIT